MTAAELTSHFGREADFAADLSKIRELIAELDLARDQHPESAVPPALPGDDLDLDKLQSALEDGTVLVAYHLGDPRSYAWTVSQDGIEGFALPAGSEISEVAKAWYDLIADPWSDLDRTQERELAKQLSKRVLTPISRAVAEADRLIVVGDGVLRLLPFSALPNPESTDDAPLMIDTVVSTLPSLALAPTLSIDLPARSESQQLMVIFADPVYDIDERAPHAAVSRSSPLNRLPGTRQEANRIHEVASPYGWVEVLAGFDATRANLLGGAADGYRILHIAGHANTEEAFRGLILSRWGRDGLAREADVSYQDLYGLELSSDLVVASACRTGLGDEIPGEGLIGLTRGFMRAGTSRVIVSLWEVQDEATAELMALFYQALLEQRLPPADSLRAARLALYDRPSSDVREWAAFVFQGDWRPLSLPSKQSALPRQQMSSIGVF
ncbi:MAG: CHAT domain-containing protein [Acidobacteriota bacterium]